MMARGPLAAVLALSLSASPAISQSAMERIEPRLSRAIEEHRVFLTCSSLEPQTFELVLRNWEDMVAAARGHLSANLTPKVDLEAFDRRTKLDALVDWRMPLGEAAAYCAANPDWSGKLHRFAFVWRIDDTPLSDE